MAENQLKIPPVYIMFYLKIIEGAVDGKIKLKSALKKIGFPYNIPKSVLMHTIIDMQRYGLLTVNRRVIDLEQIDKCKLETIKENIDKINYQYSKIYDEWTDESSVKLVKKINKDNDKLISNMITRLTDF